ncbi:MAG: ribosome maturation factor RimP [Eubacteriales bacterium]|jgi:ribosome maturation factor RimP|nr:ribosome maturation factor RimP [Eubacteriales bacterium]
MIYSKIEQKTHSLAYPIINSEGYDIYDVIYIKEGPHWFLRIFIDSENGVNLNDCETISRLVEQRLDEENFIKDTYFLEISSPGLERNLRQEKHFEAAVGSKIFVLLKDGTRHEGVLSQNTQEKIVLDHGFEIHKKDIQRANIVFEFDF